MDSVTLLDVRQDPQTACEVRRLSLSINNQRKEIYHYLFNGWPDFGKPEADDRRALVELTRVSRGLANSVDNSGRNPRFVHCSAGVGRTGTFCALDFLIAELEKGGLEEEAYKNERNGANAKAESPPASASASKVATMPATATAATMEEQNGPTPPIKAVQTWGKSGPVKEQGATALSSSSSSSSSPLTSTSSGLVNAGKKSKDKTPEAQEGGGKGDLIYETVNSLREQRMMMVMNEIQHSFLYEVMRETFVERYKAKPEGAKVISAVSGGAATEEPSAKVARTMESESEETVVGNSGEGFGAEDVEIKTRDVDDIGQQEGEGEGSVDLSGLAPTSAKEEEVVISYGDGDDGDVVDAAETSDAETEIISTGNRYPRPSRWWASSVTSTAPSQ